MEEKFPISEQGYAVGRLSDGTECQILLDIGASKSFMSKSYYMHCKSLFSVFLFIIPIIIDLHKHRFEIYTLVSVIHENVDLVLGIKNIF